jgi:hypothetical protein
VGPPLAGAWAPLVGGLSSLQAALILAPPDEPLPLLLLSELLPQAAKLANPRAIAAPLTETRRMNGDTVPPGCLDLATRDEAELMSAVWSVTP